MPEFTLEKWYADCASSDGGAVIVYSAKLDWHGPAINYTSLLQRHASGATHCRTSLRRQAAPQARDGGFEWQARAWGAEGRWHAEGGGLRETLYESPEGKLEWDCVAPRCAAEVRVADGRVLGWGYVERLRLSVAPWRLPIAELRWGRFVNATDALVWIDWRGDHNTRVVCWNGARVTAEAVGDREIVLGDGAVLSLQEPAVLREGALGGTALKVIRNAGRLFPRALLQVQERKWLSRAVLHSAGRADSVGMAIHEMVLWP